MTFQRYFPVEKALLFLFFHIPPSAFPCKAVDKNSVFFYFWEILVSEVAIIQMNYGELDEIVDFRPSGGYSCEVFLWVTRISVYKTGLPKQTVKTEWHFHKRTHCVLINHILSFDAKICIYLFLSTNEIIQINLYLCQTLVSNWLSFQSFFKLC